MDSSLPIAPKERKKRVVKKKKVIPTFKIERGSFIISFN